jgi:hypothetical protein
MEQEVCQLLLAAFCQMFDANWQKVAVCFGKTKKPPVFNAGGF